MGDLTPNTREEYFLARMAGEDVTMPEPITREEEYMKGIAAQIEAGSAELPAVTDVDEGKILAVNASGKWDKADALEPTFYIDIVGALDTEIASPVTAAEVVEAYNAGQNCVVRWKKSEYATTYLLPMAGSVPYGGGAHFEAIYYDLSVANPNVRNVISAHLTPSKTFVVKQTLTEVSSTNVFDIFWNSTGTQVGTNNGEISTEATTFSIPLSGEMNYTKSFKGILTVSNQTGPSYIAKYLIYKFGGDSLLGVSKLYEFGSAISEINCTLTGGQNPSVSATAFNVTLTAITNMRAIVTLYSV